jgi:hypothetical protein
MDGTYTQHGDYFLQIFNYHPKKSSQLACVLTTGYAISGSIALSSIPT